MNETKVATVNNVAIVVTGEELIPIKPICEALGIQYPTQYSKLKEDDFLSSVIALSATTGADGKEYEMVCLPQEFIFGWLFTINPKNVKEEAKEAVAKYRIECYRALYRHFTESTRFLKEQRAAINAYIDQRAEAKLNFRNAKNILNAVERELDVVRHLTEEDWRNNNLLFEIPFTTSAEIGGQHE